MRLRTGIAILLLVTASGTLAFPAQAKDAPGVSDAAVPLNTTAETPTLAERLLQTLPGASETKAAQVTVETQSLAKQTIALRKAAALRASRAAARAAAKARAAIRLAVPAYGRISASFGSRGLWSTRHTGMDINGRSGDRVRAVVGGRVIKSTFDAAYGRIVVIRGRGVDIWYAHLSSSYVKVGQTVKTGKTIGRIGCTGNCTGSHLHLEVRKNDLPTNPATFLWGTKRGKAGTTPAWARSQIATLDSL